MRGASAIQKVLDELPDARLRILVVWEPVIGTDVAPPTTRMLARIHDSRAIQFWDGGLLFSKEIARATLADPARMERAPDVDENTIVWDYVGLFGPAARWEGTFPEPEFAGGPVVSVVDELRGRLDAAR